MILPVSIRSWRVSAVVLAIPWLWLSIAPGLTSQFEEDPSAVWGGGVGQAIPNVNLPPPIIAPEGRLTFFADFAAGSGNQVPVYLVNRTAKPIEFSSQDGDIYVKLERQMEDGSWERTQAHQSSDCGNSYFPVTLPPGQHFKFRGYLPSTGVKARVRFASFRNPDVVSNEGDGFYLPSDLEDARRDWFGRSVSRAIESLLPPVEDGRQTQLISPESKVMALRLIQSAGRNPYYQKVASEWAAEWEQKKNPTSDEKKAAKAMREILAESWTEKRDREALLARCSRALSGEKVGGFGMPETNPELVWNVIGDLAKYGQIDHSKVWQSIRDFVSANETPGNVRGAMRVAEVPRLADELFPNSFFEKHLLDSDSAVQRVCAATLSRRNQWSRLTELGWKLEPSAQILVLQALAHPEQFDGRSRNPDYETKEDEFWKHCLKAQPLDAIYALQLGPSGTSHSFNRTVHDPLRDFLAAEAAKVSAVNDDFDLGPHGYKWRLAVEFLASWQLEEDDSIFLQLLGHRGYEKSEVTTGNGERFIHQQFRIRAAARRALLQRGQPVPTDLVTEWKLPL